MLLDTNNKLALIGIQVFTHFLAAQFMSTFCPCNAYEEGFFCP